MKSEQRKALLNLLDVVGTNLCSFCKYNEGSVCNEGDICTHPLGDYHGFPSLDYGLEPGADCWGFRTDKFFPYGLIVDCIGVIISSGFCEWSCSIDGDSVVIRGNKTVRS